MAPSKQLPRVLVVSAGMPRAGSAWYFNLTHDLWMAAGGEDVHRIREQYHLQDIMTEVNCNMGALVGRRLIRVMRPALTGHTFVVKTHSRPYLFSKVMIRLRMLKPTYIFRDPRDALLSAHEYGQRVLRDLGRPNAFSSITSIEVGIPGMVKYARVWEAWSKTPGALLCRYEDLLTHYDEQVEQLTGFLNLDLNIPEIRAVAEKYRPRGSESTGRGLHYYKGQIGRHHEQFTEEQKELARLALGDYLERMGYEA
jgi:hypothetical protein